MPLTQRYDGRLRSDKEIIRKLVNEDEDNKRNKSSPRLHRGVHICDRKCIDDLGDPGERPVSDMTVEICISLYRYRYSIQSLGLDFAVPTCTMASKLELNEKKVHMTEKVVLSTGDLLDQTHRTTFGAWQKFLTGESDRFTHLQFIIKVGDRMYCENFRSDHFFHFTNRHVLILQASKKELEQKDAATVPILMLHGPFIAVILKSEQSKVSSDVGSNLVPAQSSNGTNGTIAIVSVTASPTRFFVLLISSSVIKRFQECTEMKVKDMLNLLHFWSVDSDVFHREEFRAFLDTFKQRWTRLDIALETIRVQSFEKDLASKNQPSQMDPTNPYISTSRDVMWIINHPWSILSWTTTQLFPTFNGGEGELECRHGLVRSLKNFMSFVRIFTFTILNILVIAFLLPISIILYLSVDFIESMWDKRQRIIHFDPEFRHRRSVSDNNRVLKIYFINGIATTPHWFEMNCIRLANEYKTTVHGVYNPSYGIIADLVECLVQRDFRIQTDIIRRVANEIRTDLDDGRQVRLIAHSQGGIIASQVVDQLTLMYWSHIKLDGRSSIQSNNHPLQRLSVLTYASAANHFINPGGLIPVMRHYVNSHDLVGWSTIANADQIDGEIFVSNRPSAGHQFNASFSLDHSTYHPLNPDDRSVVLQRRL